MKFDSPWLLFAVGFVGGLAVARRMVALPSSEVIFGRFDQREIDEIVNDEFGPGSGNAGTRFER